MALVMATALASRRARTLHTLFADSQRKNFHLRRASTFEKDLWRSRFERWTDALVARIVASSRIFLGRMSETPGNSLQRENGRGEREYVD